MAKFVAGKSESYKSELPATVFFPLLKIAEFQALFHFLEDETEAGIVHIASIQRITVHRQLQPLNTNHATLVDYSQSAFGDLVTGELLYKQAVFSLTASILIGNRLTLDATKEAADRQSAMNARQTDMLVNYREAIDQLLLTSSGYTFEVI